MEAKELSWEPVHNGDIYCSPGCGSGCTRAAYEQAVLNAFELAKKLGDGWKPHVWENMGWHYSAVNGGWKVHPGHSKNKQGEPKSYTAFLGTDERSGGKWAESGKTPQSAIRNTMKRALADVEELHRMLGIEVPLEPDWPI